MAPPGEWYYNTLLCCDYISLSSVVSHAFSALCMYSKFGHHPHSLGNLCAKFCFFCDPIAQLAHGEKLCTQSLTHTQSITYPAYLMPREPKLTLWNHLSALKSTHHCDLHKYWPRSSEEMRHLNMVANISMSNQYQTD